MKHEYIGSSIHTQTYGPNYAGVTHLEAGQ
jgi:hypothetical protein